MLKASKTACLALGALVLLILGHYGYNRLTADTATTLEKPPPRALPLSTAHFTDITADAGIEHRFASTLGLASQSQEDERLNNQTTVLNMHRIMAGGIAVADINNDSLPDIFLPGGEGEDQLYLNKGGFFTNITASAQLHKQHKHLSNGAIFADISGDGLDDLFIGGIENYKLNKTSKRFSMQAAKYSVWKNQGDLTFTDITASTGFEFGRNIFSSAFADFDQDGDLDVAFGHWQTLKTGREEQHIWLNNGQGVFRSINSDKAEDFSYWPELDWSFTPNFADINNDGWQDLLYTSDFETSRVFYNHAGKWFSELTDPGVITDENGMGAAIGDYNNDGNLDWFVTSVYDPMKASPKEILNWGKTGNRLYQGLGNGQFRDVTTPAGVRDGGWGWGACMADFNLDGFLDIFHVNGFGNDSSVWLKPASKFYQNMPRLFINRGNGEFINKASEWGFTANEGRAISCTDFDRDGDIDILIQQLNQPTKLYANDAAQQSGNHYLGIKLNGQPGNPHAAGARILIKTAQGTQMREIRIGSNYLSQNAAEALFGLGAATVVDEIKIYWHGLKHGAPQIIHNVPGNQWLSITAAN